MRGFENYYRIRTGHYRIGFSITGDSTIIFYRVKSGKRFTGLSLIFLT